MPNGQFPSPKQLLRANLSVPRSIEASLPAGFPTLSSVLAAATDALPDLPVPGLGAAAPGAAGVTGFMSSIEAALPSGAPELSAVLGGRPSARKEEGAPKGARTRILGGGYRSV